MRKDSIDQKAIEAAYLIYNERGHQILNYSHTPTDYARGTVEEPEQVSALEGAFNELLPPSAQNAKFNALTTRNENILHQIDQLTEAMKFSRKTGNFQLLQSQMKQMQALIKEKERINAKQAVANLGAAQMAVYDDTMESHSYSEMEEIGDRIERLEQMLMEFAEMADED